MQAAYCRQRLLLAAQELAVPCQGRSCVRHDAVAALLAQAITKQRGNCENEDVHFVDTASGPLGQCT
jgi:hypothetical protein